MSKEQAAALRTERLLRYELEEYLPLDGDEIAIARVDGHAGSLVIAASASALEEDYTEIHRQGTHVEAVTPIVWLATQMALTPTDLRVTDYVLVLSETHVDVMTFDNGKIIDWQWRPWTGRNFRDLTPQPEGNVIVLVDRDIGAEAGAEALDWGRGTIAQLHEINILEAADLQAAAIVAGRSNAWIDLRNGRLSSPRPFYAIQRPLSVAVGALLLFQIALIGSVYWRDYSNRLASQVMIERQHRSFEKAFPNQPVPVGITSRLESEQRSLVGAKGLDGPASPRLVSVAPVLHHVLMALPNQEDIRFRIDRLECGPNEVRLLDGVVRSFEELEEISLRLRSAGFEVPDVSSSVVSDGVTLRYESMQLPADREFGQ
ncbi:hypothetical protein V7x_40590 [Crateriforma conspicua]|uniref:GspL periplasmic domain protein n=1 Tax=Crateriforma conspicua TaxID=2527996 RepID=A0A5C6FJM3_9PLAN|nr:hypothetical protein [Crateriforma conspicua]TWU62330.1 hypothetical protein V7x_40590 [Crateriforma conspicua]